MSDQVRKWGITIVAVMVAVIGIVGNLIVEPNLIVILGLLTATVLALIVNVFHNRYVEKNIEDDTYSGDDLF